MVDRLMSFKPSFAPNGAPLDHALTSVNCLVLDELEIDKGVRSQKAESIIKARYDESLPTIFTTNLARKDIFEVSWLRDICNDGFGALDIQGYNWRKEPPNDGLPRNTNDPKYLL